MLLVLDNASFCFFLIRVGMFLPFLGTATFFFYFPIFLVSVTPSIITL